jgi:hypothetical protein
MPVIHLMSNQVDKRIEQDKYPETFSQSQEKLLIQFFHFGEKLRQLPFYHYPLVGCFHLAAK